MKETLDGEIQRFDFTLRPDFGGTKNSIVNEITRDRITYLLPKDNGQVFLTVPNHNKFVQVAVENETGGRFLDARYNKDGKLIKANLWFRRYCDREGFYQRAQPSDKILDTIVQLYERESDIMFEADMNEKSLGMYYCLEDSESENLKIISSADHDMIEGLLLIDFHPNQEDEDEDDEIIEPVTFCSVIDDGKLLLGFQSDERNAVGYQISTFVSPENLFGLATPRAVQKFLDNLFVASNPTL